jgi:hypothetical protein
MRWSDVEMPEGKTAVAQTRVMAGDKCITIAPKGRAGSRMISMDPNTVIAPDQLNCSFPRLVFLGPSNQPATPNRNVFQRANAS